MSGWYWRVIAVKAVFVLTCFVSYLQAEDTIQKLPFCNPQNENDASATNDLVIVSTLDGRLTALSTKNGAKAWVVDTQPLLSSNSHHVELKSGGKWMRLIPSLQGTLYGLSADTIEPLPFDAEQLLSSATGFSEDLVVAGAHETLWLGLDSQTGRVIYECDSSGCNSEQQTARAGRDVLVLRRNSNTVRALDPHSGLEKWNFSVADHQLALSRRECIGGGGPPGAVAVAVALPEGVVAVRQPGSHALLWQHQLEAPVAGVWRLQGGTLEHLDVLGAAQDSGDVAAAAPSLYLGVHNTQLYIQEGMLYSRKIETAVSTKPLPWQLKEPRPLLAADGQTALAPLQDVDPSTLTHVALYGNTGRQGNHGFFLYLKDTCDRAIQVSEDALTGPDIVLPNASDDQTNHHHVHVHVYSLWFWWKEVLLIAVSSALLMNLMIWPRFFAPKLRSTTPLPINQENIVVERYYERPPSNVQEYLGRYESDFTPLRCLGRGGFGVVFEARNKIDDRPYAVKRITLPRRESKRERVLREVRALAKLEHENIVRYFNAWLEEPPPLWQEQKDAQWMRELEGVSVAMSDDYTSPTPASPVANASPPKGGSVMLNLHRDIDECVDALDYEKKISEPNKRLRSLSCNDSFSIVFDEDASKLHAVSDTTKHLSDVTTVSKRAGSDDDSFIVFANTDERSRTSGARGEVADKRLEKVRQSEGYGKTDSSHSKKKGHTRHWSLDMCVRGSEAPVASADSGLAGSKMYLYIQMQLCRRDSLHDWLRANRTLCARRDVVNSLFSQIASAVEYVHLAGLIHRDLKPSNIFFALDGRVKVGDFGLVTTMADTSQGGEPAPELNAHARHTHRVGTHLYMSPEQLVGRPYSYKVDIYSLGLVLFELLQPFGTEAERVACLMRLRTGRFPQEFQRHYPNEVEVLKLMLSEDPSQRPTVSGVRARAPLYQATDERWHFALPALAAC